MYGEQKTYVEEELSRRSLGTLVGLQLRLGESVRRRLVLKSRVVRDVVVSVLLEDRYTELGVVPVLFEFGSVSLPVGVESEVFVGEGDLSIDPCLRLGGLGGRSFEPVVG